jgi:hypothetical protein
MACGTCGNKVKVSKPSVVKINTNTIQKPNDVSVKIVLKK